MKFWKHTLISALAFIGVSSTVLYTACEKDACLTLKCRNGAVCTDEFCQCTQGFEGAECTLWASARFTGRYKGSTVVNGQPYRVDSAIVESVASPDVIAFYFLSDAKRRYEGRVKDSELLIDDQASGEYFRLIEDQDRITVYIQRKEDSKTTAIDFKGTKIQ